MQFLYKIIEMIMSKYDFDAIIGGGAAGLTASGIAANVARRL